MITEASYFSERENNSVQCHLCPVECLIKPGKKGICKSRFNENGILKTDNFGETVTIAIDPIEKKPLYHFLPKTDIISVGPNGCNLSCSHCQNWQISQEKTGTEYISSGKLAELGSQRGSIGVAYTYTEPIIWFEYIMKAGPLVKNAGLVNVMVSNGYINQEPLEELLPLIDAFNIDIKSMRPEFYKKICKGKIEPVKEMIKIIACSKAHLELTYLVIPELNDSDDDFHKLGEFISSIDKNIPLHLSVYHPSYKMDKSRTPVNTMTNAYDVLSQYLSYVFVGNIQIDGASDSKCPSCGAIMIKRAGYNVVIDKIDSEGNCLSCGFSSGIIMKRQ